MGYSMRLSGLSSSRSTSTAILGCLALALAAFAPAAQAQSAPYVLPYTMSTYAGGFPTYILGYGCGTAAAATTLGVGTVALDTAGDGCFASQVAVGADPHDLRVDGVGNLFYLDDTASAAVVHKINPFTQLETIYVGNLLGAKICSAPLAPSTKFGDGCAANDGVANSTGLYTLVLKNVRGLGMATNGDLFIAGYGDYYVHKIAQATGFMSLIAGNGTSPGGYAAGAPGVNLINQARGVGADANGNIYIADTGNNAIREYVLSANNLGLALNAVNTPPTTQTKNPSNGPFSSAFVAGPEDVTTDSFGNLWIADSSNSVVRAVYNGTGTLPGITSPLVTGQVYIIAGYYSPTATPNTYVYPSNGTTPVVPATTVTLSAPRKIALDAQNNLYIADAGANVVWFVDHATGYIRLLAGSYGQTASVTPTYICAAHTDSVGDGCPGPTSSMYSTGVNGTAMGVAPDNQGNLYISDAELSSAAPTYSRIRKLLSGLNFPAVNIGAASVTQTILLHFAAADTPAATNPFVIKATGPTATPDFTLGSVSCTVNTTGDLTDDCLVQLTFKPTVPGNDTATLTITSLKGAVTSYTLTGTGTAAPAIAFDPGNTAQIIASSVASVKITNGGSGYNALPTVTFSAPAVGANTATGTPVLTAGVVTSITITNSGSGYTSAPFVTFAGGGGTGAAAVATIGGTNVYNPQGIALDGQGNAYIADTSNNRVLFYNATTAVTTVFAGTGTAGNTGNGGAATAATLNAPKAVTLDTSGSVYIADTGNNVIRKVNAAGIISLYAGGATTVCANPINTRGDGCPALQAIFNAPSGLAADNLGNLYVSDTGNNVIRQISTTTNVITLAGGATSTTVCTSAQGATDSQGDGCGALVTTFSAPTGIAFDFAGKNLFVADTGDNNVRKIYLGTTYKVAGTSTVSSILINPVTLVAGNGTSGASIAASGLAVGSQLSNPTGVAVDTAGNFYIADTGNASIRLVNAVNGYISTIAGINGAPGVGTVGNAATSTLLSAPAAVAVTQLGTLFIADSANERILSDTRSEITYNFGRINQNSSSPVQNFTELNIGNATATLPNPPQGTQAPVNTQFTLSSNASGTGIIAGCASGAFVSGAICNLQAQFTPTALTTNTVTYTQSGTNSVGLTPSITLVGTGFIFTVTSSTVIQSNPTLPTNSQYNASVTLTATITPVACNLAAPFCYPSGNVNFLVDGSPVGLSIPVTGSGSSTTLPLPATAVSLPITGLSVGNHTISCNYLGDNYYAASTCTVGTITVTQASTTSLLSATNSGAPQFPTNSCTTFTNPTTGVATTTCLQTTLTATVTANTSGIPTGNVTFFANNGTTTTTFGPASLSGNPSQATFNLSYAYDNNGNLVPGSNNTLPPGNYTLTCTYNGAPNFATSNCSGIPFVVAPQSGSIVIPAPVFNGKIYNSGVKPCVPAALSLYTPSLGQNCPGVSNSSTGTTGYTSTGTAVVAIAQGATADATIFMIPSNTLAGKLSFTCTGLPADSTCTFSPTSIPLTPGTGFQAPLYVDVTFWNDLQPGSVPGVGSLNRPAIHQQKSGIMLAEMLGWPLTLLGLVGLLRLRRKSGSLTLVALLLLMVGTSLTFTGCAGPGDYHAVLTPTGTYPVTFTVTNGTVSTSVVIDYVVTPGIKSIE
jgi:hypothetical protein